MHRALAVLLLLTPLAHAIVIGPTVYEQDDLGDPVFLQDFTYSLSADCTAATITSVAMDGKNRPVEGARTYLKYVDFATPLISQGPTDREGVKLHKLPGSPLLMRGMFVLVMEKEGFRSKEIHFDISGCYSNGTTKAAGPKPAAGNGTANGSRQEVNATWLPANGTHNATNETGNQSAGNRERAAPAGLLEGPAAAAALLGFVALGFALISIFVYNIITAKKHP